MKNWNYFLCCHVDGFCKAFRFTLDFIIIILKLRNNVLVVAFVVCCCFCTFNLLLLLLIVVQNHWFFIIHNPPSRTKFSKHLDGKLHSHLEWPKSLMSSGLQNFHAQLLCPHLSPYWYSVALWLQLYIATLIYRCVMHMQYSLYTYRSQEWRSFHYNNDQDMILTSEPQTVQAVSFSYTLMILQQLAASWKVPLTTRFVWSILYKSRSRDVTLIY